MNQQIDIFKEAINLAVDGYILFNFEDYSPSSVRDMWVGKNINDFFKMQEDYHTYQSIQEVVKMAKDLYPTVEHYCSTKGDL